MKRYSKPFPDTVIRKARRNAHFKCVICGKFCVHVHHIIPKSAGGSDEFENAAPLCAGCHDTYGHDPYKRKQIREKRDQWYEICKKRNGVKGKPWQIKRLSREDQDYLGKSLLGLYEIDINAFRSYDQYGPDLLKLARMQPEAFWVATIDNEYIAYLSIFMLKNDSLFRKLCTEAQQGSLDLPDPVKEYMPLLVENPPESLETVHLYIDALALKKPKDMGLSFAERSEMARDIIKEAGNDLTRVNKATICTIVVKKPLLKVLEHSDINFFHAGGRREDVTGDKKFRELYICQGNKAIHKRLSKLANLDFIKIKAFRFLLRYHSYSGTWEGGIEIELRE